jgi:putative membrane protein
MADDPKTDATAGRFEVRVTADTHFGWIRTRLSVERTLMSWVRTAISLIGFGFTIVQFFDRLGDMPGVKPGHFPEGPRYFGLALIFCGIAALLISVWQYRWTLHYLWGGNFAAVAGMREGKRRFSRSASPSSSSDCSLSLPFCSASFRPRCYQARACCGALAWRQNVAVCVLPKLPSKLL